MLRIPLKRNKPESWPERRAKISKKWMVPFVWLEQQSEWAAYFLSHWTFLEVLEYLSSFWMSHPRDYIISASVFSVRQ